MVDKLKNIASVLIKKASRLETIILSLVILVLFGIALVQVNEAIDPTLALEEQQKAQQEQLLKQVRYDQKSLDKIEELTSINVDIKPQTGQHSENPFTND